ncbi:MAG: nucleotide sugar dehydrogenase [Myxococcales bacterium]
MLKSRIESRKAHIVVIGLGYVGLPLAVEVARVGFKVTGVDVSLEKVDTINRGDSHVIDVPAADIASLVAAKTLSATTNYQVVSEADAVIICVPTPLNKSKDPDVSFIVDSCTEIRRYLHRGQLIVLESTTYPGFTREVAVPLLEETESGLRAGDDFHVAFSPERIDPGNPTYKVKNTTKIVGGYSPKCTELAALLYGQYIDNVHPVSSTDAAEMVKLLENTFRAVNIGLVNEVAIMCHRLGVNTWEVIDAAATKPFGFMPFYPGPGLGGHCIPIDPLYLSWKLKALNYQARFIELAHAVNTSMPEFAVSLVQNALNDRERCVKGSRVLVLGVAYKKDIDDYRESPALELIELLLAKGARVSYHDPFVEQVELPHGTMRSVPVDDGFGAWDAVVIATNHSGFDYQRIVDEAPMVVDTRNATKGVTNGREKIALL